MYQSEDATPITKDGKLISNFFDFNVDVNYSSIQVEDDDMRDTLFRQQLLAFFQIEEYNETVIDVKIEHLKPAVENSEELKTLSIKFSNLILQDNFDMGIIMFFAYDYFHETFLLLKEYLLENKINKDIYNNLIKKL
jgi:hypothetical protein